MEDSTLRMPEEVCARLVDAAGLQVLHCVSLAAGTDPQIQRPLTKSTRLWGFMFWETIRFLPINAVHRPLWKQRSLRLVHAMAWADLSQIRCLQGQTPNVATPGEVILESLQKAPITLRILNIPKPQTPVQGASPCRFLSQG